MKIIFSFLILYLSINLISSFSWFNLRSRHQTNQVTDSPRVRPQRQGHSRHADRSHHQAIASTNRNSTMSSLWQRALNRQRSRTHNTGAVARQADGIPRNRFQASATRQQQYRSFRKFTPVSQDTHVRDKTNSRFPRRRFRPFHSMNHTAVRHNSVQKSFTKTSPAVRKTNNILARKSNNRAMRSRPVFGKKGRPTATTVGNKRRQNQRRLFDIDDYQALLKASEQRNKRRNFNNTHSYLRSALTQRKRRSEEDHGNSDTNYPMVFVRDAN